MRLRRIGKKRKPTYRIVVAEHTFPVNGQFVEDLGFYNPHTKALGLKKEDVLSWLGKGAQPSNTVARLLEKEKIKHKSVVVVKKNKKPRAQEEAAKPAAPASPGADEVVDEPTAASEPSASSETEATAEESETEPTAA